ncbi:MAG TPA: DUF3352 domain-containing protein [Candidatus Limnocylindrales bacterium]|nr:DUF3352 domain-containing protein [Candidatus Limnocylindrales bacterium]
MTSEPSMEPTSEPAPAEIAAPTRPSPTGAVGASPGRWAVAAVIAAAAVVVAAGGAILLGSRPTPEALSYVPGDAAVVAELRPDLPGDQLEKVGNFLAHFPGFKDQSTLSQKLDETFARLTRSASDGSVDYQTQVKPWIAGPLFAAASIGAQDSGGRSGDVVLVASTDGTASCAAVIQGTTSTETDQGVAIVTSSDGTMACALQDRYGLLGTPAMVRAALDAHASHTGMDTVEQYRTARDTLGGDRLATLYVSKAGIEAGALPSDLPSAMPLASGDVAAALARVPDWAMAGISTEDDAVVADLVTAPLPDATPAASGSPLPTLPPARASRIAPLLPSGTIALAENHGTGVSVERAIAQLQADPRAGAALGSVQSALGLLGGVDGLVGWVDDLGVAVVPDGSSATGGAVLLAVDEATAAAKAGQLKSLVGLLALGGKATVSTETIDGVEVTLVEVDDVQSLVQSVGGAGGATSIPSPALPAGTTIKLALASRGQAVLVGSESFVRQVLDTKAGASLADAPAYQHALSRAFAQNVGQVYVAAAPLMTLATGSMPDADRASFSTNVEPYLAPFDAVMVTTTLDHGAVRVRLVATVQ